MTDIDRLMDAVIEDDARDDRPPSRCVCGHLRLHHQGDLCCSCDCTQYKEQQEAPEQEAPEPSRSWWQAARERVAGVDWREVGRDIESILGPVNYGKLGKPLEN